MRTPRALLSASIAVLLLPVMALSAHAAPPTNDTPGGAVVITTLPTTLVQDTTEATTDALDRDLNQMCGAPATNASVWFVYTADDSPGFLVSMENSDYSGGFMVTEGDPALGNLVSCGPVAVAVYTVPGETYYVTAFSDTAVNGGLLEVTFEPAPPSPEISISVNATGQSLKDGTAVLTGSYTCQNAVDGGIDGTLTQSVGRFKITGYFGFYPLLCDGTAQAWTAYVVSDNGLFAGGKGASVSFGYACGSFECATSYTEQSVKLSRGGGRR